MSDLQLIKHQVIKELHEDHVGLWSIVRRIRAIGITEHPRLREATLTLVAQLLLNDQILAGQYIRTPTSKSGFEFRKWEMPPKDVVTRIRNEWTDLDRDPNPGDIVCFVDEEALRQGSSSPQSEEE